MSVGDVTGAVPIWEKKKRKEKTKKVENRKKNRSSKKAENKD